MPRTCLTLAVLLLAASLVAGQEPRPVPPDQFDKVHRLIKRQEGEWPWAELNWSINFADAQRRSRAEGKPIFVAMAAQGSPIGCV